MFKVGFVVWLASIIVWITMMVFCPEARQQDVMWIPIMTMWFGSGLMFADRK